MPDPSTRALLHTVAKLHYEADLSQVEIAQRLGLSTATVSRLLRRARNEGIVRIEVRDFDPLENISTALADRLALKRAAVVETGGAAALAGPVGALLKEARLGPSAVVAIGWGRAVRAVVTAGLPRLPGVLTVPATGGMQQPGPHFQVGEFVRLAAEQMEGEPRFIHAPYLPSRDTREAIIRDPTTSENLALWGRVDAALVGVGVPHTVVDPGRLHVTPAEQNLAEATGDVIRHYFDEAGTIIDWDGADRLVAMSAVQLRRTPLVVGIAAGIHKAKAIRGAARAGLINSLVTDLVTARALADLPD